MGLEICACLSTQETGQVSYVLSALSCNSSSITSICKVVVYQQSNIFRDCYRIDLNYRKFREKLICSQILSEHKTKLNSLETVNLKNYSFTSTSEY